MGGILHDLQNGVYSEGTEHWQGRSHYLLSDIMQWYLCPPLLYSKLSMEEFGKAEPSSQGGRTQKSPMIPNPTENSQSLPLW